MKMMGDIIVVNKPTLYGDDLYLKCKLHFIKLWDKYYPVLVSRDADISLGDVVYSKGYIFIVNHREINPINKKHYFKGVSLDSRTSIYTDDVQRVVATWSRLSRFDGSDECKDIYIKIRSVSGKKYSLVLDGPNLSFLDF